MKHLSAAALAAVALLAWAPGASARPADVVVTNTAADPVPVQVQGTPKVSVESSAAAPLRTQEVIRTFGDGFRLLPGANLTVCEDVALPAGRVMQLQSIAVSATAPVTVYLRVWTEMIEGGNGTAIELPIALTTVTTGFFQRSGSLATPMTIVGGSEFAANGVAARPSICATAGASNSSVSFVVSGVYVD